MRCPTVLVVEAWDCCRVDCLASPSPRRGSLGLLYTKGSIHDIQEMICCTAPGGRECCDFYMWFMAGPRLRQGCSVVSLNASRPPFCARSFGVVFYVPLLAMCETCARRTVGVSYAPLLDRC